MPPVSDAPVLLHQHLRAYAILAAILIVVVALVYALGGLSAPQAPVTTGALYITTTTQGSARPYAFVLDLDTDTPVISEVDAAGEQFTMFHAVSQNGAHIALLGAPRSAFEELASDPDAALQIYVGPAVAGTLPSIAFMQQLTNVPARAKRALSVSDSGNVLYMALADGTVSNETLRTAESWTIHLASAQGGDREVAYGMYPIWINTNRFLYLKDDGVHVHDLSTQTDTLVWLIEGGAAISNMKLGLSPDGRTVAWAVPSEGAVYVARGNLATGTPSLNFFGSIRTTAFWALFSPDGQTLALQGADQNGVAQVGFYDVGTLQEFDSMTLSDATQEQLFVTSWQ
jgi:hypothetical protein